MNGVPTLAFRIGNDRASAIYDANIRVVAIRTERTTEGVVFYRMYDLELVRDRSPAMRRSWTVLHPITDKSVLFGATPESFERDEVEIHISVTGTDDTSLQPVHARRRYLATDIAWGARHADILRERPDGKFEIDLRCFHDVVPTTPTLTFPYPPGD